MERPFRKRRDVGSRPRRLRKSTKEFIANTHVWVVRLQHRKGGRRQRSESYRCICRTYISHLICSSIYGPKYRTRCSTREGQTDAEARGENRARAKDDKESIWTTEGCELNMRQRCSAHGQFLQVLEQAKTTLDLLERQLLISSTRYFFSDRSAFLLPFLPLINISLSVQQRSTSF
jgi:hypothetical protein